jgi:FkbM family methyltransferase
MSYLVKKLSTANRVLQAEGLGGLKSVLSDKKQALFRRLYGTMSRSKWVWNDHWWVGKLVEIRGNKVEVDGCEFGVDSPAILTSHKGRLFFDFVYEAPEREALGRYLNPELPVVEFGASIGVIACLTNKKLNDPQRHVVVEANPDLLALLTENRDRNGCGFSILHRAIAYGRDEITFHQNKDFLCSSVQLSSRKSVTVPTASFREIVDAFDFKYCTLICDIEGGENDLIEYDLDLLGERVTTLIIEIHEKILGQESVKKNLLKLEQAGLILVCKKWETYVFQNRRINPR